MDRNRNLGSKPVLFMFTFAAVLVGLLIVTSRGAFSTTTANPGNSFTAATSFGGGGIAQVQKKDAGTSGNQTSITATFDSTPTEDNLLILVHYFPSSSTVTLPSGWSQAAQKRDTNDNGNTITMGYKVAGASESTAVTVTVGSNKHSTLSIFEYSGLVTSSPLDQSATNGCGDGRSCSVGTTGTTSQADELVIGGLGIGGNIGGWDNTWTNSFTQQTTAISTGSGTISNNSVADCIASSTGTFESTEGWNQDKKAFGVIATFKGS